MKLKFCPRGFLRALLLPAILALLAGFDVHSASAAPPVSGTRTIAIKALIDGRSWR